MNTLTITMPQGATMVQVTPGQGVAFDFDPSTASFELVEGNLVVTFGQDNSVTLSGIFDADATGALSTISLPSGTQLSGEDFLGMLESGADLATAMGPGAGSATTSGIGSYEDSAGDMLSGVTRLGSLGSSDWDNAHALSPETVLDAAGMAVAAALPAQPAGPGGSGGYDGSGGDEHSDESTDDATGPVPPHAYVKAALLGADTVDNPVVVVNLLDPDGNKVDGPFPESVIISGNEYYDVVYDKDSGTFSITLKDPSAGAGPTENVLIEVDGKTYIIQVGSSETNNLADVTWAPVPADVELVDKTWAGSTDNHLQGGTFLVDGQTSGDAVVTPDGYTGKELHLQLTNSSLTARDDIAGAETITADLHLKNGSFFISNENHSVFDVHHHDPVGPAYQGYGYKDDYDLSRLEYDASVVAAVAAKGENAVNTVTVEGGEAIIHAGGGMPDTGGKDSVNIGGVYAAEGGTVAINADKITVSASSDGFASTGGTATVSGIRSDGAVMEDPEYEWQAPVVKQNSQVNLKAEGDVDVKVSITGDTDTQDHSGMTYAGVAATEHGQVTIEAGEDVSINVVNEAAGDKALDTSGVFGIFSGYGLGKNDLPSLEDFKVDKGEDGDWNGDGKSEYDYDAYTHALARYYSEEIGDEWDSDLGKYVPKEQQVQTSVTIEAQGSVDVTVDMGSQDYRGTASGIMAQSGDVNIKAGDSINISTVSSAQNSGDISAMTLAGGRVKLQAENDINLSVSGNGQHVSVVDFHPFAKETDRWGMSDPSSVHLSGKNITLKGEVGLAGGADNSITGIDGTHTNFKEETFIVNADEKFSIDVTAHHNGGTTTSTGIALAETGKYYQDHAQTLFLAVEAPEFEIKATVDGDISEGDSRATGLSAGSHTHIGIVGYDGPDKFQYAHTSNDADYEIYKAVEKLDVIVGGARHNVGIEAVNDKPLGEGGHMNAEARVDVWAEELNIAVTGGTANGDSSSYGIVAKDLIGDDHHYHSHDGKAAKVNIETSNMNLTVDNPQNSVGISAQGPGAEVVIGSLRHGAYDGDPNMTTDAMSIVITCTVTNGAEQLNGIAIEALQGGHVLIVSNEQYSENQPGNADNITINGNIVANNVPADGSFSDQYSEIEINTGYGDDKVVLNGDISLGKKGSFIVDMGEGNDYLAINGGIDIRDYGQMRVDMGDGDDTILINGKVNLNFYESDGETYAESYLDISAGAGNDLLILMAPDAATFNDWYKDWLQYDHNLDRLSCENIEIHGVNDMSEISWLTDMMSAQGINFQVYGDDSTITVLNDLSTFAGLIGLDGVGDNDMLAVHYNGEESLDSLHDALANGSINGLEHLLVDASGSGDLSSLFGDNGILNDLFAMTGAGTANAGSNVMLRVSESDSSLLTDAGWHDSGAVQNINGVDYHVYDNGGAELLYIQLMQSNG